MDHPDGVPEGGLQLKDKTLKTTPRDSVIKADPNVK